MAEPNKDSVEVVKVKAAGFTSVSRAKGPHLELRRDGSDVVVDLCNRAGYLNYRITVDGAELEEAVSSLGSWG